MKVKLLLCAGMLILMGNLYAAIRLTPLENFDSGIITLTSWADEDLFPDAWSLDTATPDSSSFCLKLSGNCWKLQQILPHAIDSIGVIQLKAKTSSGAEVQGIGFTDGVHQIFYSFSGNRIVDIEAWVPVYQGAFQSGIWNSYQLPLAADWQAFFGYLPVITGVIYVNDLDGVGNRSAYFDAIEDVSEDLPALPRVSIGVNPPTGRDLGYLFTSTVLDPDSDTFSYAWDFGDSTFSDIANPYHLFTVDATHTYKVTLRVTDATGKSGYAATDVAVDLGDTSLPVMLNFIGDVMLARRYEGSTGIISTQGVNAIFAPTKPLLGNAADITVANLEVILANVGSPHPTKSVVYRGSPNNVGGLAYAGIDVVSLANNHTLDYGINALQQMKSFLDTSSILYSGAGEDIYEAYKPVFVNRRGLNIAFLRSCDRTGQYNDAQPYLQAGFNKPGFAYMTPFYLEQQIEAVDAVADLKIVEMHGGSEYSLTPGSGYDKNNPFWQDTEDEDYNYRNDVPHQWDIAIRHTAVDSGADLVVVHHPHIIQGLEIYHNKLIAHSLGNFAFDLDYPETMPSMILYADAYPEGFKNYRVKPVFISKYLPLSATGQLGIYILDYLAMRSTELNTRLCVDRNTIEAKVLTDFDNPSVISSTFNTTQQQLTYMNSENITAPIKLPRRGSISEINTMEPVSDGLLRLGAETIWYGNFENEGCGMWIPPAYSTTDFIDGTRSAMLNTTTSNVTSTIPNRCKIYDNAKSYTLHGWIKTNNVTTANIAIRYYNSRPNGSIIGTEYVCADLLGSNAWEYYYKELSIPPNAYYYDIRLSVSGAIGAATAWFDNVGLIEWTDWATPLSLAAIPWPNNYYWLQAKTSELAKSLQIGLVEKDFSLQQLTRKQAPHAPKPIVNIYPNPFNPNTNIAFTLPQRGETFVRIYNLKGQLVKELAKGFFEKGTHSISWDSKDKNMHSVASGIYFIKVDSGGQNTIRKAILMK